MKRKMMFKKNSDKSVVKIEKYSIAITVKDLQKIIEEKAENAGISVPSAAVINEIGNMPRDMDAIQYGGNNKIAEVSWEKAETLD